MTRLYCIREKDGRPVAAKLMGRDYANHWAVVAAQTKLIDSGKWTRVEQLCAGIPLHLQAAQWAASLIGVNPKYVLEPEMLVWYVRGPNWNDPGPEMAHYEGQIWSIGEELWHEFSSYRGCTADEAERRFRWLMGEIRMLAPAKCIHDCGPGRGTSDCVRCSAFDKEKPRSECNPHCCEYSGSESGDD